MTPLKHDYTSLKEVLKQHLNTKKLVTSKINELVESTFAEKGLLYFNFLQWYVAEQHEEKNYLTVLLINSNFLVKVVQRSTTLIVN